MSVISVLVSGQGSKKVVEENKYPQTTLKKISNATSKAILCEIINVNFFVVHFTVHYLHSSSFFNAIFCPPRVSSFSSSARNDLNSVPFTMWRFRYSVIEHKLTECPKLSRSFDVDYE